MDPLLPVYCLRFSVNNVLKYQNFHGVFMNIFLRGVVKKYGLFTVRLTARVSPIQLPRVIECGESGLIT